MTEATPPYPNQPVALALVEVRHPQGGPFPPSVTVALKAALREHFPILRTEEMTEMTIALGPNGPGPGPGPVQRNRTVPRFVARDRQTSVTFRPDAVVVETTRYPGWTAFKDQVEACLDARQDVAPVDGVERIGIRFIDEIRVPGDQTDWSEWVDRSLTGPTVDLNDLGLRALQQQSIVQYGSEAPGETLTLRYGAIDGPPVVQSTPNLVRLHVPPVGSYFLIDTDAAWTITDGTEIPPFESARIMELADHLHDPMKGLFERLITDKLRAEVLNAE